MEAVVSAHDRGKWISDLNPLLVLRSRFIQKSTATSTKCSHTIVERICSKDDARLISIDNWEELLEKPEGAAVVRAHGNWLARLATAAVSVSKRYDTIVVTDDRCEKCRIREDKRWRLLSARRGKKKGHHISDRFRDFSDSDLAESDAPETGDVEAKVYII